MSRQDIAITTPDGVARAFVFTPDAGAGPWPAVIMYMDALGIRPAMFEIAERVAQHGYYVLLPDLFWRVGEYAPLDVKAALADRVNILMPLMSSTGPAKVVSDTGAFLDWLSEQLQVDGEKVGTMGYCMGGGMTLRAAAAFPNRVAAAASFHGGNLVTEHPDSPHLLAERIKAKVLVAGADQDKGFDLNAKATLTQAFEDAGVDAEVTIYEGALHGYAPRDMPVYDPAAAERHYREMFALFDGALK